MKTYHLKDIKELRGFQCGIKEMDDFIQNNLQYSIDSHFCVPYVLKDGEEVVAFYALCFDSLVFPQDYFDDFMEGYSLTKKPILPARYLETFKNKQHYPAIDISYFAVDKKYQRRHIGSALLEDIINRTKLQNYAGCQFVVVDALITPEYNAISFYSRNGFDICEDKKAYKDCVRMYRALYPKQE